MRVVLWLGMFVICLTAARLVVAADIDLENGATRGADVMLHYRKVYGAAPGDDQLLDILVYQTGQVDAHYPSFFRNPGRHQFRLSVNEIQQLRTMAQQLPNLDQPGWLHLTRHGDADPGGEIQLIADLDITEIWFNRDVPNKGQSGSKPFHLLADGLSIRARAADADPRLRQLAAVDSGIWAFLNRRIVSGVRP